MPIMPFIRGVSLFGDVMTVALARNNEESVESEPGDVADLPPACRCLLNRHQVGLICVATAGVHFAAASDTTCDARCCMQVVLPSARDVIDDA